jgi:hypothetical protein
MNSLSSLPPPAFASASATPSAVTSADLALRGDTPSAWGGLDAGGSGAPLHVSADAQARSLDDIERDFLAALCENPPA